MGRNNKRAKAARLKPRSPAASTNLIPVQAPQHSHDPRQLPEKSRWSKFAGWIVAAITAAIVVPVGGAVVVFVVRQRLSIPQIGDRIRAGSAIKAAIEVDPSAMAFKDDPGDLSPILSQLMIHGPRNSATDAALQKLNALEDRSAAAAGYLEATLTLTANRNQQVRITNIAVEILGHASQIYRSLCLVERGPQGGDDKIPLNFDLDQRSPALTVSEGHSGNPYFQGHYVKLSDTDSQPFDLTFLASRATYSFDIIVSYQVGAGETRKMRVDNQGKPFKVTGKSEGLGGYGRAYQYQIYQGGNEAMVEIPGRDFDGGKCAVNTM